MEARKILFVMNNSSSQKSIMSEAETLGALKADMRRAGINYDNMTFYEGRTRTELKDDASVLPTNVPVAAKGTTPATTTNDLVFMLTTANKKIRSGAGDRPAAYAKIKQLGLQDACKAKYGKNFTQCSTSDLEALIADASPKVEPKVEAPAVEGVPSRIQGLTKEVAAKFVSDLIDAGAMASIEGQGSAPASVAPVQVIDVKARRILGQLLNLLIDEEDLYGNYSELLDDLQGECGETQAVEEKAEQPAPKKEDDNLSQSEINSLFGGWAQ